MKELVEKVFGDDKSHHITMLAAWTGVCVLVALGKLKPETIELLLFAMLGSAARGKTGKSDESK